MINVSKYGAKACTALFKPKNAGKVAKSLLTSNPSKVTKIAQKAVTGAEANIKLIQDVTMLSGKNSAQLYNYLPQNAQENFSTLLEAGKRLGYIKISANGKILSQLLERFLTTLDKTSYGKMVCLEQNFKGLDKASFKKLLNAYKNPEKIMENRENINRWLSIKDELKAYSETIAKEGKAQLKQAEKDIFEIFGVKPKARSKGAESIYDKLSRQVLKKGVKIDNLDAARNEIGDLVGTRLILDDVSEAGMQKVVDNLCKGIESGKIKITEIENYAKASKPYFTEAQFNQIKKAAARKGYEIPSLKYTKQSGSGYVTAQMDIVYSNGARGELQIRGKKMNEYADIEHIPYDLGQGKNLGKNIPELERFYEPVEDAVLSMNRNGLDKIYKKYILDCYKYIRKFEAGKIKGCFKLPQYPKSLKDYKILSLENLKKVHEQADKIKDAAEKLAQAA